MVAIQGSDHLVPRSAQALLQALPLASVTRLVFLGGGSLEYAPGHRSMDSPDFPPEYLETSPRPGACTGGSRLWLPGLRLAFQKGRLAAKTWWAQLGSNQ